MSAKAIWSALAIALTFIGFVPYIRSIHQGATQPHVFSWIIWSVTTLIVFLAQLEGGGGLGAWPTGVSALITIYVTFIAYLKRADSSVHELDWLFFAGALASLPLWYFTADPLWAVVVLTAVDVLGFGPTLRKAYAQPRSEHLGFYVIFAVRSVFSIVALANYSVTTVLFPAAIGAACLLLVGVVAWRRAVPGTTRS